jgi:phosphate transport system substrate-binding protein
VHPGESTSDAPDSAPDAVDVGADVAETSDAPSDVPHDTIDAADVPPPPPWSVTIDNFPRVDGATSTLPLDMIIACELLGVPWHWASGSGEGSWENFVEPEGPLADAIKAKIVHHKTHDAYLNLIDAKTDVIFQASLPSVDELAYASSRGVTLEPVPIALDALVFLLHPSNPVSGLTKAQILDIYTGRITQWDQLGGLSRAIHPYSRPKDSGSFELFDDLILEGTTLPEWPPDLKPIYMGAMVYAVSTDPDGVGYSVYYYVRNIVPALAAGTKVAFIDGIDATSETIATRTYPLTTPTYAVTRTNLDASSNARKLVTWLTTEDGRRVVKMSGYVPFVATGP